jgi:hypothetical protein
MESRTLLYCVGGESGSARPPRFYLYLSRKKERVIMTNSNHQPIERLIDPAPKFEAAVAAVGALEADIAKFRVSFWDWDYSPTEDQWFMEWSKINGPAVDKIWTGLKSVQQQMAQLHESWKDFESGSEDEGATKAATLPSS